MDRSMKVMFGMMTVAICLLAITMMGNQSQQAYAGEYVGGGDRGTEPTIVSFRVMKHSENGGESWDCAYRMWSDGAIEVNFLGVFYTYAGGGYDQDDPYMKTFPDGWILIQDSVAGYACAGDTDGNREVDVNDLLTLIEDWGQCEEDPPTGLPDDPDLS